MRAALITLCRSNGSKLFLQKGEVLETGGAVGVDKEDSLAARMENALCDPVSDKVSVTALPECPCASRSKARAQERDAHALSRRPFLGS